MPTTLTVFAHWTDVPVAPNPAAAPVPASLLGYPGTIPRLSHPASGGTGAHWPGTGSAPPVIVWCELASQTDIDAASWSGASWPGPPPPSADQGYGAHVIDFSVTQITLLHQVSGVGNDYEFTVKDPSGSTVAVITPTGPGTYPMGVTVSNGRGIWTIEINRQASSSVAPPGLYQGGPPGNSVMEPYVSPYGNRFEGLLGLEFTGEEVLCPEVKVDAPTVSSTCGAGKRTVTLTIHVTQPAGTTSVFQWNYGDGTPASPSLGTAFPVTGPTPTAGKQEQHDYTADPTNPKTYTAKLKTILPTGCPDIPVTVTIPPCPCAAQVQDITIAEGPCDAQGNRAMTATVVPMTGVTIGTYYWGWDNSASSQQGTATSPQMTFAGGSSHSVQLTAMTGGCTQQVTKPFTVSPCGTLPPTTTPPITTSPPITTPPPSTSPTSFSWCCFLIIAWMIVNTIFGVLFYYGLYSLWPVGTIIFIVVGAIATILLAIWLILCCGLCARTFWRCCVLWQWQFIGVSWIVALLGVLQAVSMWVPILGGQPWVLGLYSGYLLVVIGVLAAIAGCSSLPNPFDPRTWPPCCCPGTPCV